MAEFCVQVQMFGHEYEGMFTCVEELVGLVPRLSRSGNENVH